MVLKVQAPGGLTLIHLVRGHLARWGCRDVPTYDSWLSIEKAAAILNIPEKELLSFVSKSSQVHGIILNNKPLIVEPRSLVRHIARKRSAKLSHLIRETRELSENL